MFEKTLQAAKFLGGSLCCSNPTCRKTSDNLQLCGSSCKHPFCWECINEFSGADTLITCPICKIPLSLREPHPAHFYNNLTDLVGKLEGAIQTLITTDNENAFSDTQHILSAMNAAKVSKRTVEDFCSQHVGGPLVKREPLDNPVPEENGQDGTEKIERSMVVDKDFFIETSDLDDIGDPFASSTMKVPALFASQMVEKWEPARAAPRSSVSSSSFIQRQLHVPDCWIEESKERQEQLYGMGASSVKGGRKRSSGGGRATKSSHEEDEQPEELVEDKPSKRKSEGRKKSVGKKGENTLINAVISKKLSKLNEALVSGCDANERDPDGITAIYMAAERNEAAMCTLLIENGALINAFCGRECTTALHGAAAADAVEAVKVLLAKGASRRARDLRGRRAEDVAASQHCRMIISRHSSMPLQIVYNARATARVCFHESASVSAREKAATAGLEVVSSVGECTHLIVSSSAAPPEVDFSILLAMAAGVAVVSEEGLKDVERLMEHEVPCLLYGDETFRGGCALSRKNADRMNPPLLAGAQFYLCHPKYGPTFTKQQLSQVIKTGGGSVLSREPVTSSVDDQLRPFHSRDLSPFFILFNPMLPVPEKICSNDRLNMASLNWFITCMCKFELRPPY